MLDERARLPRVPASPASRARARGRAGRNRVARWAVPVIGLLTAGVLVTDVLVLNELSRRQARPVAREAPATPGGYVAVRSGTPAPAVEPLDRLRKPHLFAVTRAPLTRADLTRIGRLRGVAAVEVADAAEVVIDGKRVNTLAVDPSTFRAFTPRPTARSDALWRNVAAGDVVVSFGLGNDGGLTLGRDVTGGGRMLRVGAYATMGLGAIDAVVSRETGRALGIPSGNALVISAPGADTARLRARLIRLLPRGSQVVTVAPVLTVPRERAERRESARGHTWPAGSLMSAAQIRTALRAAASKLGRPYVWGAEGPDSFDCSGLVQWAFAQAGVRMPRVTHQQFVTGPQVPLDQAQPGDLLFWRHDPTNPGYISHVAIYWGDGRVLHAPRTGDVVKLSPVTTRNLAGVVRVSPQAAGRAG